MKIWERIKFAAVLLFNRRAYMMFYIAPVNEMTYDIKVAHNISEEDVADLMTYYVGGMTNGEVFNA